MRQLFDIEKEKGLASVLVELTSAFEGIASSRIAQIKDQVLRSSEFFGDLWRIYSQLRVDNKFRFGRSQSQGHVNDKELMILITSEGTFSGDIDQKLVDFAISRYKPDDNDVIVIGHHGLMQLLQANIKVVKSFKMPIKDRDMNVLPLIKEVQKYRSTTVYYQSYSSLMTQQIKTIVLGAAVTAKGATVKPTDEVITETNYIFEPSTFAVVDHLESSMMQIMLREVIMESKLAQYASRFRAMRLAHEKADEQFTSLKSQYSHAKRQTKDERLKELTNGLQRRRDS